ncbi:hypothetical protein HMPREF0673_01849 [Leyella stercorea DSM 18206]|uniref:Uncharacterized protein n=1 Tax=Leyella stercorea DSM 18206 TaxID=1002367 RepID=G6AYY7_9BACT|nr:hypothetical protein HMPREF0673_01849 [Leyella stercorea DSM 18206]
MILSAKVLQTADSTKQKQQKRRYPIEGNALIFIYISYSVAL